MTLVILALLWLGRVQYMLLKLWVGGILSWTASGSLCQQSIVNIFSENLGNMHIIGSDTLHFHLLLRDFIGLLGATLLRNLKCF